MFRRAVELHQVRISILERAHDSSAHVETYVMFEREAREFSLHRSLIHITRTPLEDEEHSRK